MGAHPDFASVRDLPVEQVEELLRSGDGPERVWAAWSLGLRHGADALPAIMAASDDAPDPGVRARLTVMLAGYGQRDALAVLATDDPDEDVRAAACRHLAGISLPQLRWVRSLIESRIGYDGTAVQLVLLELATAGLITIADQQLTEALQSSELRVRERAADHVLTTWLDGQPIPIGLQGLLDYPEADLRQRAAATAIDRLGARGFIDLLAAVSVTPGVLAEHLRAVERTGARLPWSDLSVVAAHADGAEAELFAILADPGGAARPWLLRILADEVWPVSNLVYPHLPALLAMDPMLSAEEAEAVGVIRARLEDWLQTPSEDQIWMDEDDREEAREWEARTRASVAAIDRALARAELT